jgi:hypothetical protein
MKSIKINIIVIWLLFNSSVFFKINSFAETDQVQQDIQNLEQFNEQKEIIIQDNENKEAYMYQELEDAKRTIKQLRNEVEGLKNEIHSIHIQNKRSQHNMEDLKDDLDELSDIVKPVELKSYLDRLNIYAELRTRCDWFEFKGHDTKSLFDPTIENYHEKVHMLGSNRFRLNLSADINPNVKFNSRIGVLYNWNDQNYNKTPFQYLYGERERTDTTLKVERAYVDYFIETFELLPFAISFGRLPTTDGLSTDFRENTPRRSTFPSMSYESLADGLGLSIELKNILPLSNPVFRMMYCRRNESNNDLIYRDHRFDLPSLYILTAQIETSLAPWLDNSIIMFHYENVKIASLNIYDNNLIMIPEGTQLIPGAVTSHDALISLEPVGTLPETLGNIYKYTLYFQSKNILDSGIDLFAGYAITRSDPSRAVSQYGSSLSNIDENLVQALGANIKIPLISIGLLDDANKSPRDAQAFHCGLRYTLPLPFINNPKIGTEYFKSTRYWFGLNFATEDPIKTLDNAGNSYNFYYIQPFNKWISLRVGHNKMNYDFKSGFYTFYNTPVPVDWKVTNTYFLVDAVF